MRISPSRRPRFCATRLGGLEAETRQRIVEQRVHIPSTPVTSMDCVGASTFTGEALVAVGHDPMFERMQRLGPAGGGPWRVAMNNHELRIAAQYRT
jgi:hypothetical protein